MSRWYNFLLFLLDIVKSFPIPLFLFYILLAFTVSFSVYAQKKSEILSISKRLRTIIWSYSNEKIKYPNTVFFFILISSIKPTTVTLIIFLTEIQGVLLSHETFHTDSFVAKFPLISSTSIVSLDVLWSGRGTTLSSFGEWFNAASLSPSSWIHPAAEVSRIVSTPSFPLRGEK